MHQCSIDHINGREMAVQFGPSYKRSPVQFCIQINQKS